jgi:hypothetical protein
VIVSPTGETKIETKGFQGSGCREASRFMEGALGQRTGEQMTAEFHAACVDTTFLRSQGP